MFLDTAYRDPELLFAVVSDDGFIGNDVVDSFADGLVYLLFVTSSVRGNSISVRSMFFED